MSHANGARRCGARESVQGSPRGKAPREEMFTDEQQRTLVEIARRAVATLGGRRRARARARDPGEFPSATRRLRDAEAAAASCAAASARSSAAARCAEEVARVAVSAAREDPRFEPVRAVGAGRPRRRGLRPRSAGGNRSARSRRASRLAATASSSSRARRRGLLLPQVATEWGWDRETVPVADVRQGRAAAAMPGVAARRSIASPPTSSATDTVQTGSTSPASSFLNVRAWAESLPIVTPDEDLEREFETRLRESSTLAFRVAYGVLRHREDAEDVAQEAFAKAYRSFHALRDRERFRAWLVRMTWRMAIDRVRSNRRRGVHEQGVAEPPEASVDPDVEARERHAQLWAAIDQLLGTPAHRHGPRRLSRGTTFRKLSRLLDVPEGTIKWRLFAARKSIARKTAMDDRLSCNRSRAGRGARRFAVAGFRGADPSAGRLRAAAAAVLARMARRHPGPGRNVAIGAEHRGRS